MRPHGGLFLRGHLFTNGVSRWGLFEDIQHVISNWTWMEPISQCITIGLLKVSQALHSFSDFMKKLRRCSLFVTFIWWFLWSAAASCECQDLCSITEDCASNRWQCYKGALFIARVGTEEKVLYSLKKIFTHYFLTFNSPKKCYLLFHIWKHTHSTDSDCQTFMAWRVL